MALTISRVPDGEDVWGRTNVKLFDVACDSSYPLTNGYVIKAGDVGLKYFKSARIEGCNKAAGAVLPVLDFGTFTASNASLPSSIALRLFLPSGGASAPATLTAPVVAIGGSASGVIPAGGTAVTSTSAQPAVAVAAAGLTGAETAGIGKEVGNTTDVSSCSFRIRFFG